MTRFLSILAGLTLLAGISSAQDFHLYQKKLFVENGDTLRYRILYPLHFDAHRKYPVVLFMHGSGERGSDNEKQLLHGGDLFLKPENRQRFPAIVIFPQLPDDSVWAAGMSMHYNGDSVRRFDFSMDAPASTPMRLEVALVRSLMHKGIVDTKRIYVGGLSLGGFGTFDILWRYPHLFAAAFPICGAGNTDMVPHYDKSVPVWIFHGGKDDVVPPANDRPMYEAMKQQGMDVHYTIFPNDGHDSWDDTFAQPGLLPWLFYQHRP